MKQITSFTILLAVLLAACGPIIPETDVSTPVIITTEMSTVAPETVGPPPAEEPSPTPVPATLTPTLPSSPLSPTELKYAVLAQYPDFFFCDPDFYPIARNELQRAQQLFSQLKANDEEFQAILDHNGLSGVTFFSDEQKLLIYREHKKLDAVSLELVGDQYQFQIQTGLMGQQGSAITGTIDTSGFIEIQQQEQGIRTCPICLAAGTLIDTPQGSIAVEDLHVGDAVWTLNQSGGRVSVTILQTSHVHVPASHQVVHVILGDGRELWVSPGHPTADGRALGDLKVGDLLDGEQIVLIERGAYEGAATYDILPSGDTGFYWANGILLGSTLTRP